MSQFSCFFTCLSLFYDFPAIYSSWRHQKISAMAIFGILWSAARQAALSPAFRGFPAVSHYCFVPCWPASCFMASPVTLLNRLWTWVQHLFVLYSGRKKKKEHCNDILTFLNIQFTEINRFFLAFLEICLMATFRLLLILGDGQNCRQIFAVLCVSVFLLFTGHFEFTWQQFMIGVQSSLIMFPINILIVSIFRHTRPREACCCKRKRATPDAPGRVCFSQGDTEAVNESVTLQTVMKVDVLISNT